MHDIIWAHGGGGEDIGRDRWAVTQQAWGSGTAGCANEGMVGMLMEGWGLGTGHLGNSGVSALRGWAHTDRGSGARAFFTKLSYFREWEELAFCPSASLGPTQVHSNTNRKWKARRD